ncbi:MAG: SpoIIE family protein phosphatase [Planctomycetota bacterium]|nr:SpoIIE family protein phosphatase [Planctomycetota bacterium]
MSDDRNPPIPPAAQAQAGPSGPATVPVALPASRPAPRRLRLTDLIDVETLQAIQDGFSQLAHAAASIRDAEGRLVTKPSCSHRFCDILGGPLHHNEACRMSNYAAAAAAAAEGRDIPVKYVCHAGLTQYAATIRLEDRVLGTVVLGDLPERPLSREQIAELARLHHASEEDLAKAAAELPDFSEPQMRAAVSFLQLLASTLTRLCYQQALLREHIDELSFLSETSRLLSSSLDLSVSLDNIVRTMAQVMHVKACSLRLLNETSGELEMKAACGLSPSYLRKGPVLTVENPNDQAALRGDIITIDDMRTNPQVRYREEAACEGLVSSLAVGLVAKGKPLGTLHIYTGEPHQFEPEEVRLFRAVADQAAMTIHSARLVEEVVAARQQQRELAMAAAVQKRLLPARAPEIKGYECYGLTVPSAMVGGDFHDWIELPGGNWGIAVGDVAGKGVPAAILMASVRAALRAQTEHIYALGNILGRLNRGLAEDTEASEFVTLFYGVLDSGAHRLTYCTAGHEPPVLVRQGKIQRLTVGGPLLGVSPQATYPFEAVDLASGDMMVVFSDGAFDATNFNGERFGRQRLLDSILRNAAHGAQLAIEEIQWDIRRFTGLAPRADDVTLLALKVL